MDRLGARLASFSHSRFSALARAVAGTLGLRRRGLVTIRHEHIEAMEQRRYMAFGASISYPYPVVAGAPSTDLSASYVAASSPVALSSGQPVRPTSVGIQAGLSNGAAIISVPAPGASLIPSSGAEGFDPAAGMYWGAITGFAQGRGASAGTDMGFDLTHLPHLSISSSILTLFDGGNIFTYDGSGTPGKFLSQAGTSTITYETGTSRGDVYILANAAGNRTYFDATYGAFKGSTDPYGNETTAVVDSTYHYNVTEIDRRSGGMSGTVLERVEFTYFGDHLGEAEYERPTATSGGTPVPYATVSYAYYGLSDDNGEPGDLKEMSLSVSSAAEGSVAVVPTSSSTTRRPTTPTGPSISSRPYTRRGLGRATLPTEVTPITWATTPTSP